MYLQTVFLWLNLLNLKDRLLRLFLVFVYIEDFLEDFAHFTPISNLHKLLVFSVFECH